MLEEAGYISLIESQALDYDKEGVLPPSIGEWEEETEAEHLFPPLSYMAKIHLWF